MGASLSGGVKRLVGFVMAAIVPRPLVILDEPTNDVDPVRRRLLWEEIRALGAAGSAVLLVTHNVLEAERAVERLAMMRDGHIVAQGTPASLKSSIRGRLRLEVVFEPRAVEPALPGFAADPVRVGRRLMLLARRVGGRRGDRVGAGAHRRGRRAGVRAGRVQPRGGLRATGRRRGRHRGGERR